LCSYGGEKYENKKYYIVKKHLRALLPKAFLVAKINTIPNLI